MEYLHISRIYYVSFRPLFPNTLDPLLEVQHRKIWKFQSLNKGNPSEIVGKNPVRPPLRREPEGLVQIKHPASGHEEEGS